jgi:hypothetical protein
MVGEKISQRQAKEVRNKKKRRRMSFQCRGPCLSVGQGLSLDQSIF